MFAASGLYSESSTAQRGVPVPSTSGLGAGYGMRRQNSSSSSLDRMVGEDLPAMLSTVFALGSEQAPRSGAQTVGGNMRDTSPICRRNSLDGGSNTPSESGSYCCDSPPIARHPSLHKPEQGSPCGASGYQRSQTTQSGFYQATIRANKTWLEGSSAASPSPHAFTLQTAHTSLAPHQQQHGFASSGVGLGGGGIPSSSTSSGRPIPSSYYASANAGGLGNLAVPLRTNLAAHAAHALLPTSISNSNLAEAADEPCADDKSADAVVPKHLEGTSLVRTGSVKESSGGFFSPLVKSSSFQNLAGLFRRAPSNPLAKIASTNAMPTVVFFNLPWAGHAFPTYPLAAKLVACGMKVHYFQCHQHKALLKKMGCEYHNYGSDDMVVPDCFSRNRSLAKPLQLLPATAALLPYLLETTRALGPSIIMYEASVTWGWAVARILDLPSVCVCSMNVGNTLESMNPLINDALLQDEGSREANFAIKERYGIDILAESEFYFHYSKNLNLVTTAEMINPAFERHKPLKVRHNTFSFVGPMMDKRFRPCNVSYVERLALQTKLTLAQRDCKVIYVSFGTIVMEEYWMLCKTDVKGTLNALLEAVGGHQDTFVVVVTGSQKHVQKEVRASLSGFNGQPPANFFLRAFVDQLKILESSADIFITHGGQNSLMEALYYEKPCIVIPFFGDQPENAMQMEKLGCGTHMKRDHWKNPHDLMAVINQYRVDTGPHTTALKKASSALRACGGVQGGAEKVLEMSELVDDWDGLFEMML